MENHSISRLLAVSNAFTCGKAAKQGPTPNEASAITATTDKPIGIYSSPEQITAGMTAAGTTRNGAFVVQGKAMGLAGATAVAAGDSVVIDATGALVTKAAAGYVVGDALTPAAAGEWFELIVNIRKEPA